jgi:NAD(P)-dependent dehydrogenase (short-subunit alcohol dehydrogenase family)
MPRSPEAGQPAAPPAGQVSVVTGGSAGLGLAIADALARAWSAVVLASRSAERCEQATGHLTTQTGRPALGHACGVAEEHGRQADNPKTTGQPRRQLILIGVKRLEIPYT